MGRILLLFTSVLLFLGNYVSHAQSKGDMTVGLNAIYTRGLKEEGLNINFEYFFIDRFSVSPSWSSYLVDPSASLNTLNLDFRYYTPLSGKLKVYALLGATRSTIKQDVVFFGIPLGTVENSQNGINAGIGAYIFLTDHLGINSQLKYSTALIDEAVIQLGLAYKIR